MKERLTRKRGERSLGVTVLGARGDRCAKGAWWIGIICIFGSGTACQTPGLERHEYRRILMGVECRIVLYADDAVPGEVAATRAFDRIEELDNLLSDYKSDSLLSRLGRMRAG